jgi:Zn finger protein HypA/HybF involved in hydrogenase expression
MKEKNNPSARINIVQVEAQARCQCGKTYVLKTMFDECPECKSLQRKIISGTDIVINSVEIREDDDRKQFKNEGAKNNEKKP